VYAIIGEDTSDTETLAVLIRRLAADPKLPVRPKGYNGCAEMLIKGAKQLRAMADAGCTRFVVCYDADRADPAERREMVLDRIVRPSGVEPCCVVIPVQEIEAWILADIEAVTHVFPSWTPRRFAEAPETIDSPKEVLTALSRASNKKPIYSHATHNPRVAEHLRLDVVRNRCPSIGPLIDFVMN
jgi:hypothetical protein